MYGTGYMPKEIAEALDCMVSLVKNCLRLFRLRGMSSLRNLSQSLKIETILTEDQLQQLRNAITQDSPHNNGFSGKSYWTINLVTDIRIIPFARSWRLAASSMPSRKRLGMD